jgi:hypothetical protein
MPFSPAQVANETVMAKVVLDPVIELAGVPQHPDRGPKATLVPVSVIAFIDQNCALMLSCVVHLNPRGPIPPPSGGHLVLE